MKAIVQRVSEASVCVDGEALGEIGAGLMILVCAMQDDTSENAAKLAAKISKLRIFSDETGKMNLALKDTGGAALIISQFTLAADTSRGNRPGFSAAAGPVEGKALYLDFIREMQELDIPTAQGKFGADMKVSLINDGPITLSLEV